MPVASQPLTFNYASNGGKISPVEGDGAVLDQILAVPRKSTARGSVAKVGSEMRPSVFCVWQLL